MNPWDLSAGDLLVWGIVLHLIADWPLQNDWMANNKMKRRTPGSPCWSRHLAAYVHAGIHGLLLALVFGWAGSWLALAHLIIDCRWPVAKWSRLVRQTQPTGKQAASADAYMAQIAIPVVDLGMEVRFWTDQVFHIACIAIAALAVSL